MQLRIHTGLAILFSSGISLISVKPAIAQEVVGGTTYTIVNQVGNQFNIFDGFNAGTNTFFSFERFNLNTNQTANFQVGATVTNVMARVMGGAPSNIYGTLQITGGTSPNLYFMNPAGIVFGPSATLNIPGSFTATTANGIQFPDSWFSADRNNSLDSTLLTGNPTAFGFTMDQPAAIINAAPLSTTSSARNITLISGTVISPGNLKASSSIQIAAVPGKSIVKLLPRFAPDSPTVELLPQFSIQSFTTGASQPTNWTTPIGTLPQLITGNGPDGLPIRDVTGLQTNPDGSVKLTGSNININPGDVYTGAINTNGVLIDAPQGNVTVSTIVASNFGIDINAGKLFRATGTLESQTDYSTIFRNLINEPNAELLSFLTLKTGLSPQAIKDKYPGRATAPKALFPSKMSIFVGSGVSEGKGTVSIRHGGGSQLIVPKQENVAPTATGNAPFSLGGKTTLTSPDLADRYRFETPTATFTDLAASQPSTALESESFNFNLIRNQTSELVAIPDNSSGTVGAIVQLVATDGSLSASFQSQLFGELPTATSLPPASAVSIIRVTESSITPKSSADTTAQTTNCTAQNKTDSRSNSSCGAVDNSDAAILKLVE